MSETGTATLGINVERTLSQEDEHDQDHQDDRDQERDLDVPDRRANRARRVDGDLQRDRRRDRGLELGNQAADAVHGLDDVGPRLPEDDEENGGLAVGQPGRADVLDRVRDRRDVAQSQRRPVGVVDDQRLVLRGLQELIGRRERPGAACAGQGSLGTVRVGRGQRGPHVLEVEAVVVQRRGVDVDANRGERASPDEDLPDSRHLRELLLKHRRSDVVHPGAIDDPGGQGEDDDRRIRGIHLAVGGIVGQVRGKLAPGGVDRRLNVPGRRVDRSVQVELQGDVRRPERARRGHLGHAGDAAELALERRRHRGGHGVRVGAGKSGRDVDGRKLDLRQRGDRKELERDGARERDRHREQAGRDRAPDERRRQAHAPSAGCSEAPGSRFDLRSTRRASRSNAR